MIETHVVNGLIYHEAKPSGISAHILHVSQSPEFYFLAGNQLYELKLTGEGDEDDVPKYPLQFSPINSDL